MSLASRRWTELSALTVATFLGSGCMAEPDEAAEAAIEAAEIKSPIGMGTADTTNQFPHVGALHQITQPGGLFLNNGASRSQCSATLITPGFALTAGHCVLPLVADCSNAGGANATGGSVELVFNANGWNGFFNIVTNTTTGATSRVVAPPFSHTFAVRGTILTAPGMGNSYDCGTTDRMNDLALIALDQRVPTTGPNGIVPLHPDGCLEDSTTLDIGFGTTFWTGTLVGYGGTSGDINNHNGWGTRNSGDAVFWRRTVGTGGLYAFKYNFDDNGDTWPGAHWGDSGGPFISNQGNLCGVASGTGQGTEFDHIFDWEDSYGAMYYTAIDSPNARAFLAAVQDVDGRYIGECLPGEGKPGLSDDADADGDLIPDACDPCVNVPDTNYSTSRAFADWDDTDDDGVPDICDNCPLGHNPGQQDSDGDEVGNQCDTCDDPGSAVVDDFTCCATNSDCEGNVFTDTESGPQTQNRCVRINTSAGGIGTAIGSAQSCVGQFGRCSGSRDLDNDHVGMLCDNCPSSRNTDQADSDSDGIGDECDLCTGVHTYPPTPAPQDAIVETCWFMPFTDVDDTLCQTLTGNPRSLCAPRPGQTKGVCTLGADTDEDGIGDACDGCPDIAVDSWLVNASDPRRYNCNIHAEAFEGVAYPYPDDMCDPTPCPFINQTYENALETEGDRIYSALSTTVQILPQPHPEAHPYTLPAGGLPAGQRPSATVGYRTCNCCPSGNPDDCAATVEFCSFICPVDSTQYDGSSIAWDNADMLDRVSGAMPANPAPTDYFPNAEREMAAGYALDLPDGFDDPTIWRGNETTVALDVSSLPTHAIPAPGHSGVGMIKGEVWSGILWSHVTDVDGYPAGARASYEQVSSSYRGGDYGYWGRGGTRIPPTQTQPCAGAVCIQICGNCMDWVINPSIFINPEIGIQITNGIQVQHVSHRFDTSVQAALVDDSVLKLFAVEAPSTSSARGPAFAALSKDGATLGMAARLYNGRITNYEGVKNSQVFHGLTFDWTRENFGAVLSSSKRSVFVVGGAETSQNPVTGGEAYDATTVAVYPIDPKGARLEYEIDGPKPKTVLAATYRSQDESLYVLDQTGFTGHIRRLIRIDVATWKSELLGQWPSTHLFDEQHLTNGPDGLLVLTSSISRLGTHVMVGLRPTDQGFGVDWVRLGEGRALGGPSFNRHGMTVTVDAGGEVRNSVVDRDNLEHRWFDLAECL